MIAGINKIWYQHYESMLSKGYSVNNTRIGLSFSNDWQLLNFSRDTAQFVSVNKGVTYQHSVKYSNISPSAIDLEFAKKLHSKFIVLALELNNGSTIIIGVENPLRVNFNYSTGQGAFDNRGYSIDINCVSKTPFEIYTKSNEPTPPVYAAIKHGLLYNYYAIQPIGDDYPMIIQLSMANIGWRVPQNSDFNTLITYIGGDTVAGGKLKEIGTLYWDAPNLASNDYNFNLKPTGVRFFSDGNFLDIIYTAYLWTASIFDPYETYAIAIFNSDTSLYTFQIDNPSGLGLRLMKEASPSELFLTDGDACDPYIGNDGKVYRTVKIGTQVWLADNLAETKYRNGSDIPNVTDNTQWSNLTTGACCAYNNDPNNV